MVSEDPPSTPSSSGREENADAENTDQIFGTTIDDYLLSLAEGIRHAQRRLERPLINPETGQHAPSYYLPQVDFELKMVLALTRHGEVDLLYSNDLLRENANYHLTMRPIQAGDMTTAGAKSELVSTIQGRFVAVPPKQGQPTELFETQVRQVSNQQATVVVQVTNTVGEAIAGVEVNFNLDRQRSTDASDQTLTLADGTNFSEAVVLTDSNGQAQSVLQIASDQAAGNLYIVIDAAGHTETIVFPYPPSA